MAAAMNLSMLCSAPSIAASYPHCLTSTILSFHPSSFYSSSTRLPSFQVFPNGTAIHCDERIAPDHGCLRSPIVPSCSLVSGVNLEGTSRVCLGVESVEESTEIWPHADEKDLKVSDDSESWARSDRKFITAIDELPTKDSIQGFTLNGMDLSRTEISRMVSSSVKPQTRDQSKVVRTAWEALVRWSRSWQLLNARKTTNALQRTRKVAVLGGGSFGTAMAVLLARNKSEMQVSLLVRDASLCSYINTNHVNRKYFPMHTLPHNVIATTDAKEAFGGSEYCIHAVPVQYSADFLKSIAYCVPPTLPFFSVSKGLELSSLEMMSQVIPRALGNQRQPVAVISGPSFSVELMDELPTAMVVASKDKELARAAQQLLASRYLRISTSSDIVGVEIAGALKNVLAIAAGIVEGMELGNNCMAALVAQGCSEIRWLAEKMGAKSATLAGLSGTGDIMLTCFVNLSRNRSVGVRLGSGEPLNDILLSMNQVAEGVATAGAVIALARKYRVQMPVLTAVARILENELTPKRAVLELMSLPQVEEV